MNARGLLTLALCLAPGLGACGSPGSDTSQSSSDRGGPAAGADAAGPDAAGPNALGPGPVTADPVDPRCAWAASPRVLSDDGQAVLLEWRFPDAGIYSQLVIPPDSAYLAFRAAVRADGAALRLPVSDADEPASEEEAALWRDENFNRDLAQSGAVGRIEEIACLDALLFAYQNSRVSELTHPTEFLASVLRRESVEGTELAVVFGAGSEMFVPKAVYGLDRAAELVADGWEFWYAIHNHTLQQNDDRIALGTPTLSVSDVQLTRNLVKREGLESARVTNGFFTFSVLAEDLARMRSR